ncbi:MAG: FAD-dependent oxidoreductase [Gammaproteobacteria bacterium]|nr:MAG: FAD-dependent oxidoreductase [Gammaproteobacteria bacterium]
MSRQRIAIIGTGISGLSVAWFLHRQHDISVFEAADRLGGHTATVDVTLDGESHAVDTGFIVFNDWTYPNFIRLMDAIGVASRPTQMSFSVHCDRSGVEYCGSNLNGLFAQRSNLVSPRFFRMVRDILRFNRESVEDLDAGRVGEDETLGAYLQARGYSETFINQYLVPMGAAIWSASTRTMLDFPMRFFLQFFRNHGLLQIRNRPQWRTIAGGSREYLKPLTAPFADRIRLSTPVASVRRTAAGIELHVQGQWQLFDQVVFACHSDQALALLSDASREEQQVLSAIPYQMNDVVLHTDTTLLPKRERAWACWNYHVDAAEQPHAVVTYNMNLLQGLASRHTFCVTLNESHRIDEGKVLGRYQYAHPVFTPAGIDAQQQLQAMNGRSRTWFCGAWARNGFHEDGVATALAVAEKLGGGWS